MKMEQRMNKRVLQCKLKELHKKIESLEENQGGNSNGITSYLTGYEITGNTLVLKQTEFGSVNIPLDALGIPDFDNLTQAQCQAIIQCVKGDAVNDAFGVLLGYLIRT